MPLRAEARYRTGTQTPYDPVARPLQPLQFPALGLGIALADVNVPAPLESKLLPARICCERQIEPLAYPMRRVERGNFARGALVRLLGLALPFVVTRKFDSDTASPSALFHTATSLRRPL